MIDRQYTKAVLGGTFDRFHLGHEELIFTAGFMAERIFIGIVSEKLGEKLFKHKTLSNRIQSFSIRFENVKKFIEKKIINAEIGCLLDPWGPAIYDEKADLIVVSRETRNSATKINQIRESNHLQLLDIITIPWIKNSEGRIISSTNLRTES